MRELGAGGDHPGHQHGVHRRNGGERGVAGAAERAARFGEPVAVGGRSVCADPAARLLVGGSLGDRYGRRRVFAIGVVLFAMASAWCGLSPSILQLILARGVQGVGAALLVPGSLALISATLPEEKRGQAIGTWSDFIAMMAAAGPVMGGWLVQHGSWRWVFFLNLPLAVAVVWIALARVPESKSARQQQGVDAAGAVMATVGLGGIVFALIEAGNNRVGAMIAGVIGVVALLGFLWVEAMAAAPMIPFRLFRSRNFSGANLLTLFLYTGFNGVLFFFPQASDESVWIFVDR